MKKRTKKNIGWIIYLFVTIGLITFSSLKIILWLIDSHKTSDQLEAIEKKVEVKESEDSVNTEIIEPKEEISSSNPYWDYVKMNMLDVDFNELKNINDQTKGWIKVNGTNINYPFVKASDNSFYLTHTFDKSYNKAGWVFLDYRNNDRFADKNNIIYAHGRSDKTMFGTLKNVLNNGWLNDSQNYVVKISTEKVKTLWQVFSVYRIPTTSDYLQISFADSEEFTNFANMLLKRSAYNFNTSIGEKDIILTLSTCYNNKDKVVLHAKLIKRENY